MEALKPCPFCGETMINVFPGRMVNCNVCMGAMLADNVLHMETKWNRRALPPEVIALVKAARKMRDIWVSCGSDCPDIDKALEAFKDLT